MMYYSTALHMKSINSTLKTLHAGFPISCLPMAQVPPKPKPRPRTSNCFLGCFGFSRKVHKKMRAKDPPPDRRGKIRWFAWPRFRIKKYVDTKTVPVDSSTVPEKPRRSSRRQAPAAAKIQAAVPDQGLNNGRALKTRSEAGQEIILGVGERSNDVGSLNNNTCRKRLFIGRKSVDKKTTSGGHPNSPENRPKATRSTSTLSHTLSSPPPKRKKRAPEPPRESEKLAGKLSPAVGMSIITVTLIIILLWGRLCAIICTSVFFYFIPRLRTNPNSDTPSMNKSNQINEDLIYEELKKKVVFEGFLERDHRSKLRNL